MRSAFVIIDEGRECDRELVIGIIGVHSDEFGISVLMDIILAGHVKILQVVLGNEFEAVDGGEAVLGFNHYYICGL